MLQSVILIPVPLADPIIGEWRKKYDRVALCGIPSHITLLFPFKNPSEISEDILKKLDKLFIDIKPFPFVLEKIKTFPTVIFLEPRPRKAFIQLTEKITRVFPENPPYEGRHSSINPHVTIAQLNEDQDMDSIKKNIFDDINPLLPIQSVAKEAWLMVENENGFWRTSTKFVFSPDRNKDDLK